MPTKTLQLEAPTPEWLTARAEMMALRKDARRARSVVDYRKSRNADHERELGDKTRAGLPLLTNGQALTRGTGSGFEIIHTACRCDGTAPCDHDPTAPPYSEADIAAADKNARTLERKADKAAETFGAAPPSRDAFAAARKAGSRFVWWPSNATADPRVHTYRGQPLTPEDLETLGPHSLNRHVNLGSIIEVPR